MDASSEKNIPSLNVIKCTEILTKGSTKMYLLPVSMNQLYHGGWDVDAALVFKTDAGGLTHMLCSKCPPRLQKKHCPY